MASIPYAVPITNNGAGMNMAKWVSAYEQWAYKMMAAGYKATDLPGIVQAAGETWPKSLSATFASRNTLFPDANMLYEYDLTNHMRRSYPHTNADYPQGTGYGDWEPMTSQEISSANAYYAWRENPANFDLIDKQFGGNPYNAYLAVKGGASGAVNASSRSGSAASAATGGVTGWFVQKPDGTIVSREQFNSDPNFHGDLSAAVDSGQGYKSLKNVTAYPTANGTYSLTPAQSNAPRPGTGTGPGGAGGTAGTGALDLSSLMPYLAQNLQMDTLGQQFNLEKAAQQYGEGVPIDKYLRDFYGQIMGVGFDSPNYSLTGMMNPGDGPGQQNVVGAVGMGANTPVDPSFWQAWQAKNANATPNPAGGGGTPPSGGGDAPTGNPDQSFSDNMLSSLSLSDIMGTNGTVTRSGPNTGMGLGGIDLGTWEPMNTYGDVSAQAGAVPRGSVPSVPNAPGAYTPTNSAGGVAPRVTTSAGGGAGITPLPDINLPTYATAGYHPLGSSYNPNNPATWGLLSGPAQGIAGDLDAQKESIMAAMPAGGERNQAIGNAINQSYGSLASLRQGLVPNALSGLQGMSTQKITGSPAQGGNAGSTISSLLGNQQQYNLGLQQLQASQSNANKSMWGTILGALGGVGVAALLSDARTKEDVKPFTRGLVAISKIRPVEYSYNGKAGSIKGEKGISVLAQELEDVIPEAITAIPTEDFTDTLHIQPMGLLMTAINSIKELDKKVKKLEKKHAHS